MKVDRTLFWLLVGVGVLVSSGCGADTSDSADDPVTFGENGLADSGGFQPMTDMGPRVDEDARATDSTMADRCDDDLQNGAETGIDCGGNCMACPTAQECQTGADCASSICEAGRCQDVACDDGIQNGDEGDIDCGGGCSGCADGDACGLDTDCLSGLCADGICVAISCDDGLRNGSESDTDCGGSCGPCAVDQGCESAMDCASVSCEMGLCIAPSCDDGIWNGDETGLDCGGPCGRCDIAMLSCEEIDAVWPDAWRALEDAVLDLTNARRAQGANCDSQGAFGMTHALVMEPRLQCAARRHSDDMATRDFYDHISPDGSTPGNRIDATGYGWRRYGENIYKSPRGAQEAVDGWIDSDGHCSNLMSPDFFEIGIGYSENPEIQLGRFWTQVFATPR